jgi:aspartate carbamoyltransferase catalytic subunit
LCGDIKHSRVAHSHVKLYNILGIKNVHLVAPPELSSRYEFLYNSLNYHFRLEDAVENADVISAFRFKKEYDSSSSGIIDEFKDFYSINHTTIKRAKANVKIMHPGPVNRDVELSGALADDEKHSLVLKQVTFGVAMKQAVIEFFSEYNKN